MTNTEEEMLKCALCGCEFPSSTAESAYMDDESVLICHSCMEGETAVCRHCGERHPYSELHPTEDGRWLCDKCIDSDDYIFCEHCERYALRCDAVICNDEWWGEVCASRFLVQCNDCGDWILKSESYRSVDGWLCRGCYESDYVTCEECGNGIRADDSECINGCYYCEDCAPTQNGVYSYHGFDPGEYLNKKKNDGENDDLYLGIELECDYGNFDADDFADYEEIHFEEDGSLSGRGVEMISLPMTLRYHQRFDWEEILSRLKGQGFRSHDASDCGLHVHMSRWAMPATTIAKMDVFINRASEFWQLIARRDYVYFGEYDREKRLDFTRCIYHTSSRCPVKMTYKIDYGMGYNRYTPVNVCNRQTVEIRIFRGTLKYPTLMGTIEICHALVNWLNTVPVTRIYHTEKLIQEFIEYIKHNKDRYPHVIPMLELRFRETRFEKLLKENSAEKISQ